MTARKTKLLIYTNGVVTDILYSPVLFTTINQLNNFLQENGYGFSNSELQVILNSQLDTMTECCDELTPITPELVITFPTFTTASLEIVNYSTQNDKNDYLLEVLLDEVVTQTIIITEAVTSITNLQQGSLYTFRVISQTCSNRVIVETVLQTPPILLTVTVIGEGTSPQALNGSQVHTLASGDDFYIEFDGGVINTDELWYYKSITKNEINIESLVTFTETINLVNTDGNLTVTNITQNTEIVITFTTRTAQWCTDTSCIVCDELLEEATLNTLYVYENGLQITSSPFTINTGADPQVLAETYSLSTELATSLISNQIIPSLGVCCFDDTPVISNLITTLVTDSQIDYSFDCIPTLTQYTAQIRRLPVNQLIQQTTLISNTGSFGSLQDGVDYEISVTASNCSGTNKLTVTTTTLIPCLEEVPVLNPIQVFPRDIEFELIIQASTSSVYNGDYIFQFYGGKGFYFQVVSSDGYYEAPEGTFPANDDYQLITTVSNCAGSDQNDELVLVTSFCNDLPIGTLTTPIFADSPSSGIIRVLDMTTIGGYQQDNTQIQFRQLPFDGTNLVVANVSPGECPKTFGIGGEEEFLAFDFDGFVGQYEVRFSYASCSNDPQLVTFSTIVDVLP